jgi:protein phosphatase
MKIHLPNPSLLFLIGISASGKSTFAKKHFSPTQIISSDHCRAIICDDETDQSVTPQAFRLLHYIVRQRLNIGKLTVIDATNIQQKARIPLLKIASARNIPAVAIIFDIPETLCIKRDISRNRTVGSDVINRQYLDFQSAKYQLVTEGFHQLVTFRNVSQINRSIIVSERKESA